MVHLSWVFKHLIITRNIFFPDQGTINSTLFTFQLSKLTLHHFTAGSGLGGQEWRFWWRSTLDTGSGGHSTSTCWESGQQLELYAVMMHMQRSILQTFTSFVYMLISIWQWLFWGLISSLCQLIIVTWHSWLKSAQLNHKQRSSVPHISIDVQRHGFNMAETSVMVHNGTGKQ